MGMLKDRMEADLRLQNLRPGTQKAYLRYAYDFTRYHMKPPAEMGGEEVREYLLHLLDERELKPSTVKVYAAALKFLYDVTLQRPDVVQSIRMPRVPRQVPEILSGSEVVTFLGSLESTKYRALVMTMYGAGLRVSEACRLQIDDIDSKRMVIRVQEGKGGSDRYAKLGERMLSVLREYYRQERPPGSYLFPGQPADRPISPDSVRRVVKKAVEACGISKKVTPHVLRHSFATHMLETGTDIRVIQVLLGHRSIRTTQLYTQVSTQHVSRTKSPLDLLGTKEGEVLG
jgi:site-specific recombinase XerD